MADEPKPGAVSLRPWTAGDRDLLVALMTDADVRRHLGGPVEQDESVRRATTLTSAAPLGYFVVLEGDDAVGTVTFDRKRGPWEVSFQLRRSAWGRGIMTAALGDAVTWFRAGRPGETLVAVTQRTNDAARRTLERCGGVLEEEFQQYGEAQVQYRL